MNKKLLKYLAQGILVTVPLAITLYILYRVFGGVYHILQVFHLHLHPLVDPLLIVIIISISLLAVGWLASSMVFRPLFVFLSQTIEHLPVIKHIYSPIKDFMEAFVGNKKRFTKPVLVQTNPLANIEELGFITRENLHELGLKEKVAVYIPHSYAFSGRLIIVPRSQVKIMDMKGSEAMKFIVTGGVADVNENNPGF